MPFPVSYFDEDGRPIEKAAGSVDVFNKTVDEYIDIAKGRAVSGRQGDEYTVAAIIRAIQTAGFAITRVYDPYPGQVARVQIDAYGESASEVEATLLGYAERAGAGLQSSECSYGRCVIERNLEEEWGATYSWKGRLTLHPTIGCLPSSERAAAAVAE